MQAPLFVAFVSVLTAGILGALHVQPSQPSPPPQEPAVRAPVDPSIETTDARAGTLTTLRAVDDLSATMGFPSGAPGYIVEDHEVRNRVSHLAFDRWVKGALVVGIQGGSLGVIKDIGDVRLRDTACSVLPFLQLRDGVVFDASREHSSLPDAGIALQDEARSLASAPVELGHVYLIRVDEAATSHFAAVRVVEHVPGQSVTLRWRTL